MKTITYVFNELSGGDRISVAPVYDHFVRLMQNPTDELYVGSVAAFTMDEGGVTRYAIEASDHARVREEIRKMTDAPFRAYDGFYFDFA
jgi:hypothetical protein